jgi:hypothetical protein
MAQLRFVAGDKPCVVFGVIFAPGEWVECSTLAPDVIATLRANSTFQYQPDPVDPTLAEPSDIRTALVALELKYLHKHGLANLQAMLANAAVDD